MVYYPGQKGMIFVRSQQEMLSLILNQAENTPQVRLVFLNGSRAAEKPNDQWQDYDIAWGVTDLSPFLAENHWLSGIWNGQNRPTIPPCWHPGSADW